jgi:hypothetical protein
VIDILPQLGDYPHSNIVARIVDQVMAPLGTQLRCRSASEPESAAAIRSELLARLLARLLAAGVTGWKVVVCGEPASKFEPCYVSAGPGTGVRIVPVNSVGLSHDG